MADQSGSPYEQWAAKEGIPIIRGYAVDDLYQVPLEHWQRKGGKGAFIILKGGEGFSSAYVCEIPPGASLKPQRHLFEERIYVLQGKGETKVWNEGGKQQAFAWQEYSLFSPPLNAWHQHTNTGDQPAKYVAVTDAPLVFNIYRSPDFVFNTNFVFRDRFHSEANYFDGVGEMMEKAERPTWKGGLVPDVREPNPPTMSDYGKGFGVLSLKLSGNSMTAHIGRVDACTYKKAHRHWAGAHLITVQGTGYALMWDEWDKRIKADFRKGSMYCPPEGWWHTHCNTGTEVVKHIALKCGIPGIGKRYLYRLSASKGGDMLERKDENPGIRQLFEEELAKRGLKSHMPASR